MIVLEHLRNDIGNIYGKILYNSSCNCLLMKWIGHCTEEEVKHGYLRMLEWQKLEGVKNKIQFHVHDTKEMEGSWAGLVEWIAQFFFPKNHEYGLRYNVSIVSPDLFSKHASMKLEKTSHRLVTTILCNTFSNAQEFITTKTSEQALRGN